MTIKLALLAILLGAAGFCLAWGGWHLYVDHQHVDAIWSLELQRSAAAAAQAAQAAGK